MFLISLLLLLPHLPLSLSSSVAPSKIGLLEIWDCGPEDSPKISDIAESTLDQCPAVKDSANMCCKQHDFCYATHGETRISYFDCDFKFCGCLQDAEDLCGDTHCRLGLTGMCDAVRTPPGAWIYLKSTPKNATQLAEKYGKFEDARPMGLAMKSLVDQCDNAKGMAIHCHNSAQHCLEWNGKKTEAAHDCPSIMFECLRTIVESNATKTCTALADRMSRQFAHSFGKLNEQRIGKATIEIYPIIAIRLLRSCLNDTAKIEECFMAFDTCGSAPENREDEPERFPGARRIKIGCHQTLHRCVADGIMQVYRTASDDILADGKDTAFPLTPQERVCNEAKMLALARIRKQKNDYSKWGSSITTALESVGKQAISILTDG